MVITKDTRRDQQHPTRGGMEGSTGILKAVSRNSKAPLHHPRGHLASHIMDTVVRPLRTEAVLESLKLHQETGAMRVEVEPLLPRGGGEARGGTATDLTSTVAPLRHRQTRERSQFPLAAGDHWCLLNPDPGTMAAIRYDHIQDHGTMGGQVEDTPSRVEAPPRTRPRDSIMVEGGVEASRGMGQAAGLKVYNITVDMDNSNMAGLGGATTREVDMARTTEAGLSPNITRAIPVITSRRQLTITRTVATVTMVITTTTLPTQPQRILEIVLGRPRLLLPVLVASPEPYRRPSLTTLSSLSPLGMRRPLLPISRICRDTMTAIMVAPPGPL